MRPTPIRLIALFPTSEPDIVLGDRPAKEEHDVGEREAEFAAAAACAWFGAPPRMTITTQQPGAGPTRAYLSRTCPRTADSDGPPPVRRPSCLPGSSQAACLSSSLYLFARGCR